MIRLVTSFPVCPFKVRMETTLPTGEKIKDEIQFSHLRIESNDEALMVGHSWTDNMGPEFRNEDAFGVPR